MRSNRRNRKGQDITATMERESRSAALKSTVMAQMAKSLVESSMERVEEADDNASRG